MYIKFRKGKNNLWYMWRVCDWAGTRGCCGGIDEATEGINGDRRRFDLEW